MPHLGGEVATGLELLEEGGHEKGGEEQDGGPEEHVGGIGPVVAARRPHELALHADTLLQGPQSALTPAGLPFGP